MTNRAHTARTTSPRVRALRLRRLARRWGVGVALFLVASIAPGAAASDEQPFRAVVSGDDVSLDFTVPAGRCVEMADTADYVATFRGSGTATHLGHVAVEAEHCSDQDTGRYGDGVLTLTAANGDVLRAIYGNGTSDPSEFPTITFADDVRFVDGGTGRFVTASGDGVETGTVDATTSEFTVRMQGRIAYEAASRSSA